MLDREACERRVYRLATLLTGNPNAATRVITRVVDAQPDLRAIDGAHMDRLAILHSREIRPAVLVSDLVPHPVARALADLTLQQREAWVLARVYRTPEREMSRAMDCSLTATRRHLDLAAAAMESSIDEDADHIADTILNYSQSLDVPQFYRIQRRRRRRLKLAVRIAAVVLAAAAIIAAAILVYQMAQPVENPGA